MPKIFFILAILFYLPSLLANPFSTRNNKVIYGHDDRIDAYEANSRGMNKTEARQLFNF